MPDVDGFKLLEIVGIELDLPVIMMSVNGDTSVVMEGITHGACDYLIKPVRIEELRNLWQHVVRKKGTQYSPRSGLNSHELLENSEKRKEVSAMMGMDLVEDPNGCLKRTRVNWTVDLHQLFVNAVNQLGMDKAAPKKLLEVMNVKGLTRENVASHLQKYRLYLKRLSGVIPAPGPIASFQASGGGESRGTMCILSRGKGSSSLPAIEGLNPGVGVTGPTMDAQNLDAGTRKSLTQVNASQQQKQRLSANRAQVLGVLGVVDSHLQVAASPSSRTASLDLHRNDPVPRSHSTSSHSMPTTWGEYLFHPLKVEDDMGTWPRGVQVEGFIRHWNINPEGKSYIGQCAAAVDTHMQGNETTSNMRRASLGTQKSTHVEIMENTNASSFSHNMSSCKSPEIDKEASLDVNMDWISEQLNVLDYLLDDECLSDAGKGFHSA